MDWIQTQLNNRELALGSIILCFIIYILLSRKTEIYKLLWALIKTLFGIKLFVPFITVLIYIFFVLFFLKKVNFYQYSYLQTILLSFNGAIFVFKTICKVRDKGYIKREFKKSLSPTTIITFIINTHLFSFWYELIFVIIVNIFSMIIPVAELEYEKKKGYRQIINFSYFVIFFITLITFINSILYIINNSFFNLKTIFNFIVPYFLNISLIPLIYIIGVISFYENIFLFININIKIIDKYRIIKMIGFNINKIRLFHDKNYIKLKLIKNKNELDELIKNK